LTAVLFLRLRGPINYNVLIFPHRPKIRQTEKTPKKKTSWQNGLTVRDAWRLPRSGKDSSDNQANSTTRAVLKKCARNSTSAVTKHRPKHGALTVVGWLTASLTEWFCECLAQSAWSNGFLAKNKTLEIVLIPAHERTH